MSHAFKNKELPMSMALPGNLSREIHKKVKRKVQGVPQLQAAANPWHQEEEKKDKDQRVQNK